MSDEKVEVDRGTLQEYVDGPLNTAIEKMNDALTSFGERGSPSPSSYPPAGEDGARGHQEAADGAMNAMGEFMEAVVTTLELMQDTVKDYLTTEDDNTADADDLPGSESV